MELFDYSCFEGKENESNWEQRDAILLQIIDKFSITNDGDDVIMFHERFVAELMLHIHDVINTVRLIEDVRLLQLIPS